jgi:hypothetical protein
MGWISLKKGIIKTIVPQTNPESHITRAYPIALPKFRGIIDMGVPPFFVEMPGG